MILLIPSYLSPDKSIVLTQADLEIVRDIDEFIVEDEKYARAYLKKIETRIPQPRLIFHLLNEHSSAEDISSLKKIIVQDKTIGVLSDAGCPGVADPGSDAVAIAHTEGVEVKPLIGPSSLLLSLMASGLNGQSFAFHGYLPRESNQRKNKLRELENESLRKKQTQLFIETPYRNDQLFSDILLSLRDQTRVCIATDITSKGEKIKTKTIAEWKKSKIIIGKVPAVFLFLA